VAEDPPRSAAPARGRPAPWRAALALAALLGAASCSLDYGAELAEDLSSDVPDTVVTGFVHTVVEGGSPRFRLEAERGEAFQAQRLMRLTGVRFTEYAPRGTGDRADALSVSAEGWADSAVLYTDTESAKLSGAVRFYSSGDGVRVESGYLEWDGEARTLKSRADTVTTLIDDDGSRLMGSGFEADAARRSFAFRNRAEGRYVAASGEPGPGDDASETADAGLGTEASP